MKKIFNWPNLAVTVFIFLFMWGFGKLNIQFDFLNVFEQVLEDFELTDLYYTKIRDAQDEPFDERVVLVNIGDLSRRDIARMIHTLSQHNPKAMGIDAFFRSLKPDSVGDAMLAYTIQNAPNFVLVSGLTGYDSAKNEWEALGNTSHPMFTSAATATGYANTVTEESGDRLFNTWKKVRPKQKLKDGTDAVSFAAKLASFYDSTAYQNFIDRGYNDEFIYFKGNIPDPRDNSKTSHYFTLEGTNILQHNPADPSTYKFDPSIIEDKIVLLGYMGSSYDAVNWDGDKFYTPLNEQPVGRTYPDMYGVVIHANIISMILDQKFIDQMNPYLGFLIAFVLCYLNVAVFVSILKKPRLAPWYGAISKLIQLVEIVVLFGLILMLFANYLYKVDFSIAFFAVLVSGDLAEIFMDILGNVFKTHKVEH